jgi:hypothetical protein
MGFVHVNKDIYNYYEGCNGRLNDIYSWCLPTTNDLTWKYPSMGNADEAGKSTEDIVYTTITSYIIVVDVFIYIVIVLLFLQEAVTTRTESQG